MKRSAGALCIFFVCASLTAVHAQQSPHEIKMKIFGAWLEEAKKHLDAGDQTEARLILLGLVGQRMSYDRNKAMAEACANYDRLVARAWGLTLEGVKGSVSEAKAKLEDATSKFGFTFGKKKPSAPQIQEVSSASDEEVKQATALCSEFKVKLKDYDFVFYQVSRMIDDRMLSRSEQSQRVSKLFETVEEARKVWLDFAAKAPQPKAVYAADAEMVKMLDNYATGFMWAVTFGSNVLVPEYLECAKNAIAEAKQGTDAVTIKSKADEALKCISTVLAINAENNDAKSYQTEANELLEKAEEMRKKEIAQNRLPEDKYRGKDKKAVIEGIKKAFEKRWSKEKVLKVVIISPSWTEKAEAWEDKRQESIEANVFRFIDAAVAVEKEDGRCFVYYARFARPWTGKRDEFGEIVYSESLGKEYEILRENIK